MLASEKTSIGAVRLFELLPRHPIVTVASAIKLLETTTGKKRDRSFSYRAYLDRLKVGTELGRSAQ
jgi:hypothetical protein